MISVTLRRSYDVPARVIYDAWTNPAQVERWMAQGGRFTAEPRVGGDFRLEFAVGERVLPSWGTYLRLEPPRLVEFTWTSPHGTFGHETLVRVEITDLGTGCEMVLTHTRLRDAAMTDDHRDGWGVALEMLTAQLRAAKVQA